MAKKLMNSIIKRFKMVKDEINNAFDNQEEILNKSEGSNEETNTEETQEVPNEEGNEGDSQENVVKELENQIGELKDKYLRLFAEFENYKKRTAKEKLEMISSAGKNTIVSFLPVLDDFERAKMASDAENSTETFSEGVNLVYNKFQQALKNQGLRPIEIEDGKFDPEYQEAISEIPAPTEELKGKVLDVVEKGYFLGDKVIRYAKVVVGK